MREMNQVRRELGPAAKNIFCSRPTTMEEVEEAKAIIDMCKDSENKKDNSCLTMAVGAVMKCKMEKMKRKIAFQNRFQG